MLANTYAPTASVIGSDLAKIVFAEPYDVAKLVNPTEILKLKRQHRLARIGADIYLIYIELNAFHSALTGIPL